MINRTGAILLMSALLTAVTALGQQDPKDKGLADTVRMDITVRPDANTNQLNVTMQLYVFNDVQRIGNASLGFKWINDNLQMTEGAFSATGLAAFDFLRLVYRNDNIDSTNMYDRFQFTGARMGGTGLIPSMTPKHVATYQFTLSSWTVFDSLVVDTARVFGALLSLVDYSNVEYRPIWAGRVVVYDANRPILSNLILSEDTLRFQSIQGLSNPPSQTFRITSDRNPLVFNLVENVPWLLKSPSTGTTPQDVTVSINTSGLAAGTYFDSLRVESAGASNSPQFLYVGLQIDPQAPTIGVNRTSFFFNALAGGSNPAPQYLTVFNAGQSNLHWSVAKTQSWLALDPTSGTDSGVVTLSINTAGLSFGQFYDTLEVSDPAATNSPVRIPVRLSVASDLPVIVIDSIPNFWPVNWITEGPMFTRSFGVRNGGPGDLDFWVESHSSRILNITPDTSSAPDSVTLLYYVLLNEPGKDPVIMPAIVYDTVWVYSLNAINSPVAVECRIRLVEEAAVIELSTPSLEFNVYECWQGYGQSLPTAQFTVRNVGGDNPLVVRAVYDPERFQVVGGEVRHEAPFTYQVNALLPNIPTGTYYDTIWVTSEWALNKPQPVQVRFNYLPAPQGPEILVPNTPLNIAYQEDSGPQIYNGMHIYNLYPGCMNWQISEDISWLTPQVLQGAVPSPSPLLIDPVGMMMGEHRDTLLIHSPTASNTPLHVPVALQVWSLRGDVNWNGRITIQDIAWMIDYVFNQNHPPQPTLEVGDVDCDGNVNVGDIILVIEYLFENFQPLCGNPY